jgi:hypothetical protein
VNGAETPDCIVGILQLIKTVIDKLQQPARINLVVQFPDCSIGVYERTSYDIALKNRQWRNLQIFSTEGEARAMFFDERIWICPVPLIRSASTNQNRLIVRFCRARSCIQLFWFIWLMMASICC